MEFVQHLFREEEKNWVLHSIKKSNVDVATHSHFSDFCFLFTASVSINRAGIATLLLLFVYFVLETYEAECRFWIIPTYSIMNVRHTTLCVCNVCKKKDLIPPTNRKHFPFSQFKFGLPFIFCYASERKLFHELDRPLIAFHYYYFRQF